MTARQTWLVIFLTLIYLAVELSFNARLLDLVGSGASQEQLHAMEVFGRSMSGLAVALFIFQWLLAKRNRSGSPRTLGIVFWCMVAGGTIFFALQLLVDHLVLESSPSFRKSSMNIVLLQRALVKGDVALDGLNDDPALFSKPAGKAFVGLFPIMAMSVNQLEMKIRSAKLELISRAVEESTDGPAGYHERYVEARKAVREQWERYQKIPDASDLEREIASQQDSAWADYLTRLGQRGWAPSSVPVVHQARVRQDVRRKIPVPSDWDLADETGFREAVASKVRSKTGSHDGSVKVDGQRIPAGLSWPAFFGHPALQARLMRTLRVPAGTTVRHAYNNADDFTRSLFKPMVRKEARTRLAQYDAPESSFADGEKNEELGRDAARAVLVPPIALFFSLLGAVLHISKFFYLLASIVNRVTPALRFKQGYLVLVPATVFCSTLLFLRLSDNAVTNSRLYTYMNAQVLTGSGNGTGATLKVSMLAFSLHVVAVGQDYGYPFNELLRTRVLRGFDFGYHDEKK